MLLSSVGQRNWVLDVESGENAPVSLAVVTPAYLQVDGAFLHPLVCSMK